jgi:hypothetical protein
LRAFPQYKSALAKFPYRVEDRIKAVQRLIAGPGPLAGYRDELDPLVDKLLQYERIRHFLAHGWLNVYPSATPPILKYRMYQLRSKANLELHLMECQIDDLSSAARDITEYAQSMVSLFRRIYIEQNIDRDSEKDDIGPRNGK